jgi:hypothetical protein
MGLLDDAIREHLQLKKARGASDLEIAQQESEALGPARRQPLEPEPAFEPESARALDGAGEPAEPGASQMQEAGAAGDLPPEPVQATPLDEDLPPPGAEMHEVAGPTQAVDQAEGAERAEIAAPEVEPETEREPEPEPEVEPEPGAEPEPEAEPAPGARLEPSAQTPSDVDEPPPAGEVPLVDDEPAATDDEHSPGEPASGSDRGEDLLEETPEFLQDTPEHDQLWFEQKPPRDFDLD